MQTESERTYLLVTKFSLNVRSLAVVASEGRSDERHATLSRFTRISVKALASHGVLPWVVARACAMGDPPAARPRAGGELCPGGPGAVNHHGGAELTGGHTAALQAPLEETRGTVEKLRFICSGGNERTRGHDSEIST